MRQIPGVPLIYLHGNAPTLERPSAMTENLTTRISDGKTALSQHQKKMIAALKQEILGAKDDKGLAAGKEEKKKKRRGPKGPNPLSCKKKKKAKSGQTAPPTEQQINEAKKRKRRSRKKAATANPISQPVTV